MYSVSNAIADAFRRSSAYGCRADPGRMLGDAPTSSTNIHHIVGESRATRRDQRTFAVCAFGRGAPTAPALVFAVV